LEAFNIRHSGLDPESRMYFWIPAFAGMTAQFGPIFMQRLGIFTSPQSEFLLKTDRNWMNHREEENLIC
jgi:hypothetical protein